MHEALAAVEATAERKGLPTATYSEQVLLGAVLTGATNFDEVNAVLPLDSFSLEKHRKIYKAMRELHAKKAPLTISSLGQYLKDCDQLIHVDGLTYIAELIEYVPPVLDPDYHVQLIDKRYRSRVFIEKVLANVQDVINGGDYEQAQEAILKACQYSVQPKETEKQMWTAEEITGGNINTFFGAQRRGVSTGISRFDEDTYGLHEQELVVIGGAPGSLKTSLLTQVCARVAVVERERAHIISLEMSREQLLQRTCCQMAGIPFHLVRTGEIAAEQRMTLVDAYAKLADAPFLIDDSVDWNLIKIRNHLRHQALLGQPVRLLGIDYLQLMPVMQTRKERRDLEVGEITRGLKLLSREFNLTIILLSQLSRDHSKMNRKPIKSDLKESSSIEQDADLIGLLWHNLSRDFEQYRECELILEKQRNGPTGSIPVYFDKRSISFTDR